MADRMSFLKTEFARHQAAWFEALDEMDRAQVELRSAEARNDPDAARYSEANTAAFNRAHEAHEALTKAMEELLAHAEGRSVTAGVRGIKRSEN